MIKRGYKLIICVVLVSALFIGFGSAFASAEPALVTRIKATVAAALLANSLVMEPVNVALDTLSYSVVDPLNKLEWNETLPEYLEKSTIKVVPDFAIIDDVPYSQVFLGPEAADKLRLKGLDFTTAYNILNNQSTALSYAEGVGYYEDIPIYLVNGQRVSAKYSLANPNEDYVIGNFKGTHWYSGNSTVCKLSRISPADTSTGSYPTIYGDPPYIWIDGSTITLGTVYQGTEYGPRYNGITVTNEPFSFDYTSGVVDAPIAEDDGLLLTIPSEYSDLAHPEYNYDIHDLINIYPQVTQDHGAPIEIDPDLNPDFQTDIDLGNNVGDLIRIILSILDILDHTTVEFAPEPESPQPGPVDPDPAIPDTPVSDQDGTWLDELLRWIKHAIDTISQSVIDAKDAIINELQDLRETIQSIPEQILEDIETGPSKVFRKAIDVLKSLFLPLLLPIKAMMGLWHYVVEWIASINAPFLWIFGVMSGTSANMVLPIYAVLAGSICIAIYKALGR